MFYGRDFIMHNKILAATWVVACSSMSIFTLLPAIKTEDVNMMYVLFSELSAFMHFTCDLRAFPSAFLSVL